MSLLSQIPRNVHSSGFILLSDCDFQMIHPMQNKNFAAKLNTVEGRN